jgi:hypothetical protein
MEFRRMRRQRTTEDHKPGIPHNNRTTAQPKPGSAEEHDLPTCNIVMKLIRQSTIGIALFPLMIITGGCSPQFRSSSPPPLYQLPLAQQVPIGSAYPGTRELMDAPSNDPALSNDRNGVELRP